MSDPTWAAFTDEQLLEVRMCDLGVTIEGTDLEARIAQLNTEMDARGLTFRPYYWLSDEWFTPSGVNSKPMTCAFRPAVTDWLTNDPGSWP